MLELSTSRQTEVPWASAGVHKMIRLSDLWIRRTHAGSCMSFHLATKQGLFLYDQIVAKNVQKDAKSDDLLLNQGMP